LFESKKGFFLSRHPAGLAGCWLLAGWAGWAGWLLAGRQQNQEAVS